MPGSHSKALARLGTRSSASLEAPPLIIEIMFGFGKPASAAIWDWVFRDFNSRTRLVTNWARRLFR